MTSKEQIQKYGFQQVVLFYVYVLIDPRDESYFYVGATGNPRARGLSRSSYTGRAGGTA